MTVAAATITVSIPSPLRDLCGGVTRLSVSAPTVLAALRLLEGSHPALYTSVCDETGAVRRHVNLFVNNSHIRERNGLDTSLNPGDVLTIMPAVSGG